MSQKNMTATNDRNQHDTVMTPAHPRWREFIDGLCDLMAIGFSVCQKDFRGSKKVLTAMGGVDVPASLAFFQAQGARCDCEVVKKVMAEPSTTPAPPALIAEMTDFFHEVILERIVLEVQRLRQLGEHPGAVQRAVLDAFIQAAAYQGALQYLPDPQPVGKELEDIMQDLGQRLRKVIEETGSCRLLAKEGWPAVGPDGPMLQDPAKASVREQH